MDRRSRVNPDVLIAKWSSKSADDRRIRVRDNQRRHRERARSHVAQLESKLAGTELQLLQALATVQRLTAELGHVRASGSATRADEATTRNPSPPSRSSSQPPRPSSHSPLAQHQACPKPMRASEPDDDHLVTNTACRSNIVAGGLLGALHTTQRRHFHGDSELLVPTDHLVDPLLACAPRCETWVGYDGAVGNHEEEYCTMPPPKPKESTTRCRDANQLITERNYAGLEPWLIHRWLRPGYRGPVAEGDGCRVDHRLLFALLDHITSP
ncbi:hypothetical protein HRG_006273 [Hirsutella rhossiliensis]|uniref:BZIP domain-containing protein n=1 Tax=Hirsutella rhossiliensis TaxID=111463 RepID=A0A9P8MXN0_9HYPO|nr:uncharacterized protein HRG_06273 [Hirsutella rhossiliensis]KAH0962171.1 hypothetical protein HRG_06273 [Hirsutella rhossiliensis]